jgi:hypothetical protein
MVDNQLLEALDAQEALGRQIVCCPCPFHGWSIEAWRKQGIIYWRENLGEKGRGPIRADEIPDVHPFGWIATAT